jgi:hypothetical protein
MEVKAWFGSNFHKKGLLKLTLFWEWNYKEIPWKI